MRVYDFSSKMLANVHKHSRRHNPRRCAILLRGALHSGIRCCIMYSIGCMFVEIIISTTNICVDNEEMKYTCLTTATQSRHSVMQSALHCEAIEYIILYNGGNSVAKRWQSVNL